MNASQAGATPNFNTGKSFGTPGYRSYILFSLTLLYTLNFIDRVLISILAQPIIEEFKLQDWQFGLLSGFGFAFMYTLLGIPIARLSERVNRVRVIAVSVILWSIMTILCGLAGSFIVLLLFRVGVGVGEAGLSPSANSLIADYFVPRSRARAMGIYAMGVTLGGVFAAAFGGPLADLFSWRTAFIAVGAPGIVIGLIFLFTVKEPPRGYSDPPGTPIADKVSMGDTLKELFPKPTFWFNTITAALIAFVGYGYSSFQAAYFQRAFDISLSDVAWKFLVPAGLVASLGAFMAGWLTERLSGKHPTAIAWIPGWGLIASVPFYWLGFSSDNLTLAIAGAMIGAFLHYSYLGAQYTIAQGVASARSRATAVALFLFVVNMVGYGLGPLFVGILSDIFMNMSLAASPFASELTAEMCKGTSAGLIEALGQAKADVCLGASSDGLRRSILVTVSIFAITGVMYLFTCRYLQKDLVAKMN